MLKQLAQDDRNLTLTSAPDSAGNQEVTNIVTLSGSAGVSSSTVSEVSADNMTTQAIEDLVTLSSEIKEVDLEAEKAYLDRVRD